MNHLFAALGLAGALLLGGIGLSIYDPSAHASDPMGTDEGMAMGGHSGHVHGGAHDWHGGQGTIPTAIDGLLHLERRGAIVIGNDSQFNPANGVRSGSGTFDDPYIISGWNVDSVGIANTHKAFEFKENRVNNILVLDWTGQGGYVHHNYLANLRTNRNVARTGDASATVIENNQIMRVEQLRHFDGEVRDNVIGDSTLDGLLSTQGVVFDIAGLDGAGIHDNLIYGGVDMKLHGHHHSSAPGEASHNHGATEAALPADEKDDHHVRYVDFQFFNNHIIDRGFGLRYNDLNHAGDDRTATSEQEPDLELPHVHYTSIRIHDNVIEGSALNVQVVNAQDERHLAGERAVLELANNTILKPASGNGVSIVNVRDATVLVHGNQVQKSLQDAAGSAAIFLSQFHNTTVRLEDNTLGADGYGIRASRFDPSVHWSVARNDATGVAHPLYWDSSVANAPDQGASAPEHEEHGHDDATAVDAVPVVLGKR